MTYPGSSLIHALERLLDRVHAGRPGAAALALGTAAFAFALARTAAQRRAEEDLQIDEVDEASWESFPASDPPSYTGAGV